MMATYVSILMVSHNVGPAKSGNKTIRLRDGKIAEVEESNG